MSYCHEKWCFERRIVRAATRKRNPSGIGMRRPGPAETPLSNEEIFFGVARGLIKIPPLASRGVA